MSDESPNRNAGPLPPTGPFEQINALCESFSGEWQLGDRPAFDDYLAQVAENAQPTLLRNLLHIEVERRRSRGERPTAEEYVRKLPQHASLIRLVFLDSSSAASTGHGGASSSSKPAADRGPVASRLGDYQLLRELGRGGMGAVYEAVHVKQRNRVALKTLPSVDPARLHLFKREFRALADVNHPNLVGLHGLESDGCHWFFTMDLIEGVNFLDHVRPGGVLDESRLRRALAQLVTAVMALHARHVIHRDLKPANVLVTAEGHVVVLDFGLVLEQDHSWSSDKIAGTPRYMAPEQALGGTVTAACDWYAVGVMLYESLGGRPPFSGTPMQILQAKQTLEPPPLAGDNVPDDLAALAIHLLARDPDKRPDPLALVKAIAAQGEPAVSSVKATTGPRLVGREQQLAALQDAYRVVRKEQQPLTVFVRGRSGEGKTALAEHFLEPLRRKKLEVTVMSGRCYDRESVPFKALDSLIDALGSYLRSLPETDAALLLPDDIGVLVQVFPVLGRVKVVEKAPKARTAGLDEQQVRQRAFAALRKLLLRIGDKTPVVWCVDDLQWGDADSAEALFGVLRPPEAPVVLFLGTYRSDEAEGSPFLRTWEELKRKHDVQLDRRDVSVGPLSVEECTELVIAQLGQDSEAIRKRAAEFAQESRGNPFLLIELVGCFDPHTDSFQALPMHEVIRQKLGRLPADAGRLLEVIAVSGQALLIDEASRAAGHGSSAVSTLTHMRNERLVRLVGTEEEPRVDTYHDRIRETVLGNIDEQPRRTLHRTLAEVIEQKAGGLTAQQMAALEKGEQAEQKAMPRVYDLAYHFDAAGEKGKAWTYALLAAEQARRQFSLAVAASQYALARRNAEGVCNAIRFRMAEGCSQALQLLGRYDEANEWLKGAIDLVEDPEKKARIEALLGEIAYKQGKIDHSIALCESGLRRLGVWVPRSQMGLLWGITWEAFAQAAHTLLPFLRHRKPASSRSETLTHLFNWLSYCFLFRNTFKLFWGHLAGMNRAELVPPSPGMAFYYGSHACIASMMGWHSRGSRYGLRAREMASGFDDLYQIGHSRAYPGIGLYAAARYEEGLTQLCEAAEAFEKTGDFTHLHIAHFHQGCCHYGLGDLGQAVTKAREVFASAARIGDSRVFCSSYLWARATRGNIPFEQLSGCYPNRPDDVMSTVHGVMAEGHWHSHHGRTKEALDAFQRAASRVWETMCVNSHMILTMPELAGAMRRHADAIEQKDARECARLRKRAHTLANRAAWITRLFPAAYPLALRELSLILAARGKTKKALKYATKSCAAAEKQKARYEHAQSLLVRGRLAKQLGLPEGDEQIRTAEAALDEIEKPVRTASARTPGGPNGGTKP